MGRRGPSMDNMRHNGALRQSRALLQALVTMGIYLMRWLITCKSS